MFIFSRPSKKYTPVANKEETDFFLPNSSTSTLSQNSSKRTKRTATGIHLLLLSSTITIIFAFYLGRRFPSNLDRICTQHTTKYSPIQDEIPITYHIEEFDGRFVQENIYRQKGSPEVDAAWEALGINYDGLIVPESLAAKTGLTKDHVRINQKYGGGYPVFMEGMHQLHCLNFVRKSLFYNYDYYHSLGKEEFSDPDDVVHWHVSHCLDFIRQRLMCTMDIGVFGSVWVGNRSNMHTFTDFNTKHVCRNFDQIREWARLNQMPDQPGDFLELPGEDVKVSEFAP